MSHKKHAGGTPSKYSDEEVMAAYEAQGSREAARQLGMVDIPLGSEHSDAAAGIRKRTGVSVADAHLGAAIQKAESNHVIVITSDPHDMRKVAEGKPIELVVL